MRDFTLSILAVLALSMPSTFGTDVANIIKNGDFEEYPLHKMPKSHPAKELLLPPGWNMAWAFWGILRN